MLKLQQINSNNLSVISGENNVSVELANRSPTTFAADLRAKVLVDISQGKSTKPASKPLTSKSKERKNRMAHQPYMASSKAPPSGHLQGQLINLNPKSAVKAIESLTAQTDLRKTGQLTAFTHKLATQEFFDEHLNSDVTIDKEKQLQSPDQLYLNSKDFRQLQLDALNIKKTQSLQRMAHEPELSPTS